MSNIPSARDVENLISVVTTGVFALMAPEVTTVSLWVAAHNKTYSSMNETKVDESPELGSIFMKRCDEAMGLARFEMLQSVSWISTRVSNRSANFPSESWTIQMPR